MRPSKLANVIFVVYFWYKILYFAYRMTSGSFGLNFSQKLTNVPPGHNFGKRTHPQIWGAPSRRPSRRRLPSSVRPSPRVRPVIAVVVLCPSVLPVPSSVPSSFALSSFKQGYERLFCYARDRPASQCVERCARFNSGDT